MNSQSFIDQLDQVIYQYTGQHLDTLQVAILKGVLDDRKYADIAENCYCSLGHIKDESYELWRTLSQLLGEDIKKSNAKAAIERFITNHHSPQLDRTHPLNLPPHLDPTTAELHRAQTQAQTTPSTYHTRAILKLHHHGLSPAAIADTLEISPELVTTTLTQHTTLNP